MSNLKLKRFKTQKDLHQITKTEENTSIFQKQEDGSYVVRRVIIEIFPQSMNNVPIGFFLDNLYGRFYREEDVNIFTINSCDVTIDNVRINPSSKFSFSKEEEDRMMQLTKEVMTTLIEI